MMCVCWVSTALYPVFVLCGLVDGYHLMNDIYVCFLCFLCGF